MYIWQPEVTTKHYNLQYYNCFFWESYSLFYRFDWYQTDSHIIIAIMQKGVKQEDVELDIQERSVRFNFSSCFTFLMNNCRFISFSVKFSYLSCSIQNEYEYMWHTTCISHQWNYAKYVRTYGLQYIVRINVLCDICIMYMYNCTVYWSEP